MSDRGTEHGQAGRDSGDPPDSGKMWEERRRRASGYREASQAARAGSAGKGRGEIREIYIAELTARGLTRPNDTVLDAIVDGISGNPFPAARGMAESLAQMGKGIHRLSRIIRSGD